MQNARYIFLYLYATKLVPETRIDFDYHSHDPFHLISS
jgi:hypothetical protein